VSDAFRLVAVEERRDEHGHVDDDRERQQPRRVKE